MVFKEFVNNEEVEELQFDMCPFWLHMLGITLGLSNEKVEKILGGKRDRS